MKYAMNCATTAVAIEMLLRMLSVVGPWNYILDGGANVLTARALLEVVWPIEKSHSIGFWGLGKRVSCGKMNVPILFRFRFIRIIARRLKITKFTANKKH